MSMAAASTSVLLVEDEDSFIDALTLGLTREGFSVRVARDGAEALELFDVVQPDVVLLDVMLPHVSGLDVCRELRSRSDVPILLVTARSSEIDVVVGLEVGADDCITKPYRMRELVARMRAVLRRRSPERLWVPERDGDREGGVAAPAAAGGDGGAGVIEVGDVLVDPSRHEVRIRGRDVQLPLKEFELLALLLGSAGRVLTRDLLMDRVWGEDYVGDTKTLDVHIKRLRAKVEPDPTVPERIVTIRGLGYKYVPPPAEP
jgi:two-component system response regulator RegX3